MTLLDASVEAAAVMQSSIGGADVKGLFIFPELLRYTQRGKRIGTTVLAWPPLKSADPKRYNV
jgi:hypothetical protein